MVTYDFISSALALPVNAMGYTISEQLSAQFPEQAILEAEEGFCDIEKYAEAGLCTLETRHDLHNQFASSWDPEDGVWTAARNAWYRVEWRERMFDVLVLTWSAGFCDQRYLWIIADDKATAQSFFAEVSAWNAEVRDEVLVFEAGYWNKSDTLFQAIQSATFEKLVLAGSLKEEIRDDLTRFFAMREAYERHGVPWKRGLLFVGPPGNGKTHAVKALVNAIGKPCLYVKSVQAEDAMDHDCIRRVFTRARKTAPCILVLEDLDALINAGNRAFFLNELDGFAANTGILTLATTNHPERLDPAIVDRPSRFDRKYPFNLPGPDERLAYMRLWASSLSDSLRPTDPGLLEIAEKTAGFSFAYLKELFLSSMMRWIASPGSSSMDAVLLEQSELLRTQMASRILEQAAEQSPEDVLGSPG
jgi:hypothetical protein